MLAKRHLHTPASSLHTARVTATGDAVKEDDVIAQIETDKVTIDVKYTGKAPGVVSSVNVKEQDTVEMGRLVAVVEEGEIVAKSAAEPKAPAPKAEAPKAAKVEAPKAAAAKAAPPSKASQSGFRVSLDTPSSPGLLMCFHYDPDTWRIYSRCDQLCLKVSHTGHKSVQISTCPDFVKHGQPCRA